MTTYVDTIMYKKQAPSLSRASRDTYIHRYERQNPPDEGKMNSDVAMMSKRQTDTIGPFQAKEFLINKWHLWIYRLNRSAQR